MKIFSRCSIILFLLKYSKNCFKTACTHVRIIPHGKTLLKKLVLYLYSCFLLGTLTLTCSRQGFYFKHINADTAKYLQDVGYWDGDYGDVSAVQTIPYSKPDDTPGPPPEVKTVATGFQSIPETMIQQFLDNGQK